MPILPPSSLLEQLHRGVRFLSDGAVGTELIAKGVSINDILSSNQNNPSLVQIVHQSYILAGSDIITANTFGLRDGGTWREDMEAGLELAFGAAENSDRDIAIFFSVLPSTVWMEGDWLRSLDTRTHWSSKSVLLLETCTGLDQTVKAVSVAKSLNPTAMAVTFHIKSSLKALDGSSVEEITDALTERGVDILGANCGDQPDYFVEIAHRMRVRTQKPALFQPGAGTAGKTIKPDDFAELLTELFDKSIVNIAGGCCGVTPAHIERFHTLSREE